MRPELGLLAFLLPFFSAVDACAADPGGVQGKSEGREEEPEAPVVEHGDASALKAVKIDGNIEEGEYRSAATLGGGTLTIRWRIDGSDIWFGVSARTTGWISLGFDPVEAMRGADMVLAWVDDKGAAEVQDQFCTGRFGPHEPDEKLGGKNDIAEFAAAEKDGITTFEFKRRLDTGDEFDKVLSPDRGLRLIWAIGKTDDPKRKHLKDGKAVLKLDSRSSGAVACPPSRETPIWPIHAGFMDLVAGLCIAAFVIARRKRSDKQWLGKHKAVGLVIPLILLGALATGFYMIQARGGEHFGVPHAFVGAAASLVLFVMPALGYSMFWMPSRRATVRLLHIWVGRLAILAALAGSMTGLFAAGVI